MGIQWFFIVWPERRNVPDDKIMTWAADAVANKEILADEVDLKNPASCAQALHDAGLITLASAPED